MVEPKRARGKRQVAPAVTEAPAPVVPAADAPEAGAHFPIVGIGASAGGLEALEVFLQHTPADSGMAFVVVQHMDPTHVGLLAGLLQRVTSMNVSQISDGVRVAPNRVYVIPPNAELTILRGLLHLAVPAEPRGLRLPIDHFFQSLAEQAPAPSVGVILSGMGSDGTLGLKAIKAKGGVAIVQEPASAKFDGMPGSAIAAGVADIVAPVEALPEKLIARLRATPAPAEPDVSTPAEMSGVLDEVLSLLRAQSGRDFSQYKKNTLARRVERRMSVRQIDQPAAYVQFLKENPRERDLLFKELLIGVTSFFRDPAAWDALKASIITLLQAKRPAGEALRAWVAGCSTGEEAYSLAIVCGEALDGLAPATSPAVQIFATDLDRDAVDRARTGRYPETIAVDVSPERLKRFFIASEHGYQIIKSIRETVIFAPHDVTTDPPFTKLDVLTCRNLLIYLTTDTQHKLMPRFHYALRPGGIMFLGTSETVGAQTDLFAPLDGKARIFRRAETSAGAERVNFAAPFRRARADHASAAVPTAAANMQSDAEQLLLRHYAPAAVLVNAKGDILFVSGRTGKYLEPASGKANWNVFVMARPGLREELGAGFRKALRLKQAVTRRGVKVETAAGVRAVDVTVQVVKEPGSLHGMVAVVFHDVAIPAARPPKTTGRRATNARVAALTDELRHAQREVRTSRANMQDSQEELSALNEELQSSNEELQSTNEELTTSKEEMQSMNEELQTLNHELQARVDSLSHLTNDMKNLLDNTEIATVFLDLDLRVRLFTAGSSRIFPLIAGDVGRPITDFASALAYPTLADDAREVLRTLAVHEQPAATSGGGWVLVRIMPYRTLDNAVDGVTITFSDITASREREQELQATQAGLEQHIEAQARQIEQAERKGPHDATRGPQTPPDTGTKAPSAHERRR